MDINPDNLNSVTLTAIWLRDDIFTISTMQEMTSLKCSNTTTPNADATTIIFSSSTDKAKVPRTVLRDTRDNKKYLVSKLADGNCWMSQNLELDLSTQKTLTKNDTNLETKDSFTPENDTQTTTGTQWTMYDNQTRSYRPPESVMYYRDGKYKSSSPTVTDGTYEWERAGNFYNFYAATAGVGTYEYSDLAISDSICPKGWQLPTPDGNKSFNRLVHTIYNIDHGVDANEKVLQNPINLILNGNYGGYAGSIDYTEKNGHYFTNNTTSYGGEWHGQFWTTNIEEHQSYTPLQNTHSKMHGFSIRCVNHE